MENNNEIIINTTTTESEPLKRLPKRYYHKIKLNPDYMERSASHQDFSRTIHFSPGIHHTHI